MGYSEFEKHLNNRLNNRSVEVRDDAAMWDAIESELPKKKKRRFILWWWSGFAILLLVGCLMTLSIFDPDTNLEISKKSAEVNNRITPTKPSKKKEFLLGELEKVTEKTTSKKDFEPREESQQLARGKAISTKGHSSLKTENNTLINGSSNDLPVSKKDVLLQDKTNLLDVSEVTISAALDMADPLKLKKEDAQLLMKLIEEQKILQENTNEQELLQKQIEREGKVDPVFAEGNEKTNEKANETIASSKEDTDTELYKEENEIVEKDPESNSEKTSSWAIGITTGYYNPIAQYGENGNQALLNLRQEIEEPLEAFDLGMTLDYTFTDKWSISTGILYSRINQTALNEQRSIENRSEEIVVAEVRSGSNVSLVTDEGIVPYEVQKLFQRHVSYSSIAIPILVRYTNTLGKRWGWTTSAGFEYSLKSSQSSYEQDLDGVEYDLATDLLKRTNKNSSHYALLGLRLNYHFSTKIHFNIGVQSKYAISDLYRDATFQKRYFLPGVTSGLIINF